MFRKKAKINGVNFWLAYCISLACRRHGVYINREEVQKLFSKENENKTFEDFNQFLSKKKLVADVVNINRLTFNHSKENATFSLSLYGKIDVAGSNGKRILNQMIVDMKKQSLIKDVMLINQKPTKENSMLFTIDITI